MGRFKTHEERQSKIMAKKQQKRERDRLLKKLSKQTIQDAYHNETMDYIKEFGSEQGMLEEVKKLRDIRTKNEL